jgi:RimJ/RimL family protein N-acetyltransferase
MEPFSPTSPLAHARLIELDTARLHLRQWREDDLRPFADLNADPEVMAHFPAPSNTRPAMPWPCAVRP